MRLKARLLRSIQRRAATRQLPSVQPGSIQRARAGIRPADGQPLSFPILKIFVPQSGQVP
jgi:hypothetical protein